MRASIRTGAVVLATAAVLGVLPGLAFAERTASPYDEDLPVSFVGTQPGSVDGREVAVIGIHPDYIRIVFQRKKKTVPTDRFRSMKLMSSNWDYTPATMSFEDVVRLIAITKDYETRYGAKPNSEEAKELFARFAEPAVVEVAAESPEAKPLPPAPMVTQKAPIPKAPSRPPEIPEAAEPAAAPAGGFDPKNVPDWVKYLSAAAIVIVLVKFFRG